MTNKGSIERAAQPKSSYFKGSSVHKKMQEERGRETVTVRIKFIAVTTDVLHYKTMGRQFIPYWSSGYSWNPSQTSSFGLV